MFKHWKDHFHPHVGNDNQPIAYQAGGAIALALVIMAIVAFSGLQTTFITQSERFLAAVLPSVLVDLANQDRAKEGFATLEPNDKLAQAAQLKANHMAEYSYFAHDAPDGTTPWEWFQATGYEYELAGENLAVNFSDSADVERAWMNSPTHRENILEQGFTEIGIATAKGEYEGDNSVFVVQMFGRPSAAELASRQDNESLAVADTVEDEDVADSVNNTLAEPSVEAEQQEAEEDTITTSRVAANSAPDEFQLPAPVAQVQGEAGISLVPFSGSADRQASQFSHLLSQPEFIFKTLLLTLFALVAMVLLISVGVEAKRHHVDHALKSLAVLVVLLLVFYFGTTYLFTDPEVANYSDNRLSADMSLVEETPSL